MTEQTPQIVVTVAAPVEAVWDALRDKEKIRHWHGWEYEGAEGTLDQEIDVIYFDHVEVDDAQAHVLDIQGGDKFEVEPHEGGAKITLTRAAHGDNPDWDAYYDDVTEGWTTFLNQLRFALERHPDEPRRTLFYSGTGTDQFNLPDLPAGTPYELDLIGERVTGTVWFVSENQRGLTVDGWGDGLLVLSHVGPNEQKPEGAAMAVLSLYGLDDAARAEIDKRWNDWWPTHYPNPTVR
ncbi:SRPBCC family protein [Kribbella endophytica]